MSMVSVVSIGVVTMGVVSIGVVSPGVRSSSKIGLCLQELLVKAICANK